MCTIWYMDILVTTFVRSTREAVWDLLSDVCRWPDWLPTVDAVTPVDPGAAYATGQSFEIRQPRLPRATWTLTEWMPGDHFTWVSRSRGVTATGGHSLREAGDGSVEVTLTMDWTGPLAPLVRLAYGRLGRRYVETEAAAVRERLDGV